MNGVHDMGGMHGLGPIEVEKNEPVFHAEWEAKTFALNLASGFLGKWNIDISRFAREQMPAAEYLATTYYEHWLWGLRKLLVDRGLVTPKELETGQPEAKARDARVLRLAEVTKALRIAARPGSMTRCPRSSSQAIAWSRAISTRQATRDCPATRAAGRA